MGEKDYTDFQNTPMPDERLDEYIHWLRESRRDPNRSIADGGEVGRGVGRDQYDYDLQGYFQNGGNFNGDEHATDLFKKGNHPTVSDQSMYQNIARRYGVVDALRKLTSTRQPYPYEDKLFRQRKDVAGMWTGSYEDGGDDNIILNYHNDFTDTNRDFVHGLEGVRKGLGRIPENELPIYKLTKEQQAMPHIGGYADNQRDITDTITSRILVGDPSVGNYTPEQFQQAHAQYPKIVKALGGGEVSKKGMDIGGTWDKDKFNATQTNIDNAGGRKQLQNYFKGEGMPVAMPQMGILEILKMVMRGGL